MQAAVLWLHSYVTTVRRNILTRTQLNMNFKTKKKQELKTAAVTAWQRVTSYETQHLVMSINARLQALTDNLLSRNINNLCLCLCPNTKISVFIKTTSCLMYKSEIYKMFVTECKTQC